MKVVVISGPTATGKTQMAIDLAQKFGGEVVNFDSLLLYKEINIGTAKPTLEEMAQVQHHMVGVSSIAHAMNASEYANMSRPIVDQLLSQKKNVYLVGGSGFYLQALLKGMYDSPTTPQEILLRSQMLYDEQGIGPFIEVLKQHDPESFKLYHENDHYRIRRAVEHWWANGTPLFEARLKKEAENAQLPRPTKNDWEVLNLYLDLPKDEHLKIIEQRTKKMIELGLIDEVRSLLAQGFTGSEKPLQSIGYKETLDYIKGEFSTLLEYKERIIISTRQLAKAQRTWFNRDKSRLIFHPLLQRDDLFKAVDSAL